MFLLFLSFSKNGNLILYNRYDNDVLSTADLSGYFLLYRKPEWVVLTKSMLTDSGSPLSLLYGHKRVS